MPYALNRQADVHDPAKMTTSSRVSLPSCWRRRISRSRIHTATCSWIIILGAGLLIGVRSPQHSIAGPGDRQAATNGGPVLRTVTSKNFQIRTDLSEDESRELLTRLETMLRLVAAYWGRPHRGVIPMYVAKDVSRWPATELAAMDPAGVQSMRTGGGVTVSQLAVLGNAFQSKAVVYAVADRGTPQHEAVHAYCTHAFGTTGPVWYAEGMAEVGHYWQDKDDKSVQTPEHVVRFLKQAKPQPLRELVDNPLDTTGDSWESYTRRWALCHLLGHNENYAPRFKPLGLQLLNLSARDVSFWQVYGPHEPEIEFEYRLFLENLQPGYRVDLCTWDWKTKFRPPRSGRDMVSHVEADRGWQASRLRVTSGTTYDYTADGNWSLSDKGSKADANGTDDGTGRLEAVIFSDYQLSDPIDLGAAGSFTATTNGNLYLRCADNWGQLADNDGRVTVRIKRSAPERAASSDAEPE